MIVKRIFGYALLILTMVLYSSSCKNNTVIVKGKVDKIELYRVLGGYKQEVTYSYKFRDSTYSKVVVRGNKFELLKEMDSLLIELDFDDPSQSQILRRLEDKRNKNADRFFLDSRSDSSFVLTDSNNVNKGNEDEEILHMKIIDDLRGQEGIYSHTTLLKKPMFPGGIDSLKNFFKKKSMLNITDSLSNNAIEVYFRFIIDQDGDVSDFKLLKDVSFIYENEASKLVSIMPKWKPGEKDGKHVKTLMELSIFFEEVQT